MNKSAGNKLIKLAIRHAEISAEIKEAKDLMGAELSLCTGIYDDSKLESKYDNCLTKAYSCVKESRENYHSNGTWAGESCDFDEELQMYGCEHCNKSRKQKRLIGKLKQERGRIHSALTCIGKTLK